MWVTCWVLGGLELPRDQLAGLEEAADPWMNRKSVPAVQSSTLGNSVRVARRAQIRSSFPVSLFCASK